MHILIADDQEMSKTVLSSHLRSWGHTVIETSDGTEALDFLTRTGFNIDMLITDWSMPNMDGVELSRRVRTMSAGGQYIYIILLTDHTEFEDKLEGFSMGGVDDYLVKPCEPMELQLRIEVGNRTVKAERAQRLYSQSLERVVRQQTEVLRETQREIISRLFNALESRDHETGGHVRRIGIMSSFLGTMLSWSPQQVDAIGLAAPMHDIGKIGVADSVLLKPGSLTPEEFEEIKQHTIVGARILSGSENPVIQMAETIALYHHENWDGSGYPEGLSGTNIPIEARVVALVDVYDALLSDRVYRPALPEETVLEMISQERGRKFDPEICDLMLNNIEKMRVAVEEAENGREDYDFSIMAFS